MAGDAERRLTASQEEWKQHEQDLEGRIASLQEQYDEERRRTTVHQEDLAQNLSKQESLLSEAQQALESKKTEYAQLKEQVQHQDDDIRKASDELQAKMAEVGHLQEQVQAKEAELAELAPIQDSAGTCPRNWRPRKRTGRGPGAAADR